MVLGKFQCRGFGWLVVFGLNGPLRQYFSLCRAVFQRDWLVGCFGFNVSVYSGPSPKEREKEEEG